MSLNKDHTKMASDLGELRGRQKGHRRTLKQSLRRSSQEYKSMKKLILVSTLILSGCAYKGDVYLYSPSGAGNAIEKSVDADLDVPLLP